MLHFYNGFFVLFDVEKSLAHKIPNNQFFVKFLNGTLMNKKLTLLSLLIIVSLQFGCIRTRAIIHSDPPGAKVTMNNKVYGYTTKEEPLEIMLNWYWFYDFELEQDGYDDYEEQVRVRARPYAWIPIDLIFEILPIVILQEKEYRFVMQKTPEDDPDTIFNP